MSKKIMMKYDQTDSRAISPNANDNSRISRRESKKREEDSDFKCYSWDYKQNYIYITYLQNFRAIFNTAEERKRIKVFNHISKLITSRNPHQIKSHHQKMMIRHENIDNIIDYLRNKIVRHIKNYPESLRQIEKLNLYCQTFFLKQSGYKRKVEQQQIPKYNLNQNHTVKIEEPLYLPNYVQFKYTEAQQKGIEQCEVKVQEDQQIGIIQHQS